MSPESVTERLHFFVADYSHHDRVPAGGGDATEGEDIEMLKLPLDSALNMIKARATSGMTRRPCGSNMLRS